MSGVPIDSIDVEFTSRQDEQPREPGRVAYPRNLQYVAYIVSSASDDVLEALRERVQRESPVLSLVAEKQDIDHGRVVYTPSPAQPSPDSAPGLRDFLVEKRAALQRRAAPGGNTASAPLKAVAHVEGGTGLRNIRIGEAGFQVIHDAPREAGGFDLGLTVEEHQLGVMGTCLTLIYEIQAAQRQVVLDKLEVHVEGTLTPRTSGGAPSRLRDVRYTVHIASPAPAQEIDELRKAVEAVCPIYNLLKDQQPIVGRIVRGQAQPSRRTSAPAASTSVQP